MNERAEEYRAKLDELRGNGNGRWRTPTGLRDEITTWALSMSSAGHAAGVIPGAIQVSESTVARWMSERGGGGCLCRVRVEEESTAGGSLAVVTPGGFGLEGLDVDQAVNVLH